MADAPVTSSGTAARAASPTQNSTVKKDANGTQQLVVVDLGKKQKRKRIRQLRKGRGKLLDRVKNLVNELQEEGAVAKGAQPIVIVVREEARGPYRLKF